jgi:hypothetical protein
MRSCVTAKENESRMSSPRRQCVQLVENTPYAIYSDNDHLIYLGIDTRQNRSGKAMKRPVYQHIAAKICASSLTYSATSWRLDGCT